MVACSEATVLQMPGEVIEHALTFLHPLQVAKFSQTCQLARTLVYGGNDSYLWRQLFLAYPFDDPRKAIEPPKTCVFYDWKGELQRRIRAELIVLSGKRRMEEQNEALETIVSVCIDAMPVRPGQEKMTSDSLKWATRILRDSQALDLVSGVSCETVDKQLVSRLRSYFALSLDTNKEERRKLRTESRCFVYDLRNYRRDNFYGPYGRDGKINWVHIEKIVNVIQLNLGDLRGAWSNTRPTVGLQSIRAYSAPGSAGRAPEDWAGVEGTWRRYVCFMDYRDLFAFNYSSSLHGTRDPSFFDDCNFQEATRLIELKLHLVPASALPHSFVFVQPRKTSQISRYPNLFFAGTSKGVHGNEATVNGSVSMGDDGIVRWRFASIYDGHTQWSSEGVQLGHVASAAGIIGTWTGAMHDHGDPVGPFWLWKVSDDHPSHMVDDDVED